MNSRSDLNPPQLLAQLVQSGLSFALWREPGSVDLQFVASHTNRCLTDNDLMDCFLSKGFLFAPFDTNKHPFVWIPDDVDDWKTLLDQRPRCERMVSPNRIVQTDKEDYMVQATELIGQIHDGKYQKVILSRTLLAPLELSELGNTFDLLCAQYSNAYLFCVYTPDTGIWMGATPELLLKYLNGVGSTVALAGTRKRPMVDSVEPGSWRRKELDEQGVVASYIKEILNGCGVNDLVVDGPKPISAGQVMHLKTTFDFKSTLTASQVASLALQLHPTPAVSGFPKILAMNAIAAVEKHDREYYGGFHGYVNGGNCSFYVTLRCMKVTDGHAILYVGGGLTHDSDPEQEWEETVLKSQTLLSVLKNI